MNHYIENLLGLKDVIIEKCENTGTELHIFLSMQRKSHSCPCCQAVTSAVHDYRTQKVKDIPSFGLSVTLHLRKRRYVCSSCGKRFAESIPFLPKYQRTTNRLWMYILGLLKSSRSMEEIGRETKLSGASIARILDKVSYGSNTLPSVISLDEFKGNTGDEKYQCILTNPKTHEVLDILPTRKTDDLCRYFSQFKNRSQVEYVTIDMSSLFRSVARSCFPKAKIVADKFHVVRLVSWAFEAVRKEVQKKFHKQRRRYFKHSRKLLLKRIEKLEPDEMEQISHMLALSKELASAYYLKNEFYKLMESKDSATAKKKLSAWLLFAGNAQLPEFDRCVKTITNWSREILNAFDTGLTNGFTEGCNNKIKVIKRNAYGMRDFQRFRKRILHVMS